MTELDLEIDLHKNSERQGPGSKEDTLRALSFIQLPSDRKLKVADIGCGTGGQTITLAQNIDGHITAVDLAHPFLNELNGKSKVSGVSERIKTLEESMDDLSFEKESLDLIWSEGAIYNIGFETGVKKWGEFLKPEGYFSISEITWITNTRPKEVEDFWQVECPEISTASGNIKTLEDNGFTLLGYFSLDERSWITNYYEPIKSRFAPFLLRHNNIDSARRIVDAYTEEIEFYERFKAYYSYGFYVAKKDKT